MPNRIDNSGPKPLTPLEHRCYDSLQAFQKQHGRLPTHRELAEAAGLRRGTEASSVLHRLVCKGRIESDKLPSTRVAKPDPAKEARRRSVYPRKQFVPKVTDELVSAVLVRTIQERQTAGLSKGELARGCGVQHGQLQQLLANGTSLRTPALDRLCRFLRLQVVPAWGDQQPSADLPPSEALRNAIIEEQRRIVAGRRRCPIRGP